MWRVAALIMTAVFFLVSPNRCLGESRQLPILFPIKEIDQWGFIDRSTRMVVKTHYDKAYPFSEGLAVVVKDEKAGLY